MDEIVCTHCAATGPQTQLGWVSVHWEHVPSYAPRFCSMQCMGAWNRERLNRLLDAILGNDKAD